VGWGEAVDELKSHRGIFRNTAAKLRRKMGTRGGRPSKGKGKDRLFYQEDVNRGSGISTKPTTSETTHIYYTTHVKQARKKKNRLQKKG